MTYKKPEPSMKVLAFDIGIRNLAWCLLETTDLSGTLPQILGWQNYDLLAGSGTEEARAAAKVKCSVCQKALATFSSPGQLTCQRHCPATHPPLKDLSGVLLKKLPALAPLKSLVAGKGISVPKKATRADYVAALAAVASLPVEKLKVKKAVETNLSLIHDGIRKFVAEKSELLGQSTLILLENQPVLKNPTMKTVQILLFATLRDILPGIEGRTLRLVHAGKKVQGKTTGDAGYKDRKEASEAKVKELLTGGKVGDGTTWLTFFQGHGKRSDLADAFCMCYDMVGT
jgi:hypothetical protein